jgi:hypothetical protein
VLRVANRRVLGAVDVAVEDRHRVVRLEQLHHGGAVAREPLPLRLEIEERPVREDDDRRRLRVAREIVLQPRQLLGTDGRLAEGDVVERDEVDAAVIERVVRLAEVLAEQRAAVERGVVLARHVQPLRDLEARADLAELREAARVLRRVFAVVRQIAREEDEVRLLLQTVDQLDGALERLRAEGIGRAAEADVRVAELHDRERRRRLAVAPSEEAREHRTLDGAGEGNRRAPRRSTSWRCRSSSRCTTTRAG